MYMYDSLDDALTRQMAYVSMRSGRILTLRQRPHFNLSLSLPPTQWIDGSGHGSDTVATTVPPSGTSNSSNGYGDNNAASTTGRQQQQPQQWLQQHHHH